MKKEEEQTQEKEIEMPKELIEALKVITGDRPESFQKEFSPNTSIYPQFNGAGFGGESIKEGFIKARDQIQERIKFTDNKVSVFDISDESQNKKYSEVLDATGDPESGIILAEEPKDPQIFMDASAPLGYRAIVVIKTARPMMYLKKKGERTIPVEKSKNK